MNTRVSLDQHPHGLLLVVARHVLRGLHQGGTSVPARDVPPYSADPVAFARQMEVFDRMRETEREFAQLANGGAS